jgi:hypothetical protein
MVAGRAGEQVEQASSTLLRPRLRSPHFFRIVGIVPATTITGQLIIPVGLLVNVSGNPGFAKGRAPNGKSNGES